MDDKKPVVQQIQPLTSGHSTQSLVSPGAETHVEQSPDSWSFNPPLEPTRAKRRVDLPDDAPMIHPFQEPTSPEQSVDGAPYDPPTSQVHASPQTEDQATAKSSRSAFAAVPGPSHEEEQLSNLPVPRTALEPSTFDGSDEAPGLPPTGKRATLEPSPREASSEPPASQIIASPKVVNAEKAERSEPASVTISPIISPVSRPDPRPVSILHHADVSAPSSSKGRKKQLAGQESSDRNINVLSLGGGGSRVLSSLFILRELMRAVKSADPARTAGALNDDDLRKPCNFFDIIGGVGTGGSVS
jgi:hypothetical protein